MLCLQIIVLFYFLLNLWSHFAFMSCLFTLNVPTILDNWLFHYKFITARYIQATCSPGFHGDSEIPNICLPLNRPYMCKIIKVSNNILFLFLTRNFFLAPLPLISGNAVLFYECNISDKCSRDAIIYKNASIDFVFLAFEY